MEQVTVIGAGAVTKGLGHPMGPLRLLDMAGIDVSYLARMDEYQERKTGKGFYAYS